MIVDFDAEVFLWAARTQSWFFAAVPPEIGEDIRQIPRMRRGFGAVSVRARIGATVWSTSIFPDSGSLREPGGYVLPLKRAVRQAEGIGESGTVRVRLEVLDG